MKYPVLWYLGLNLIGIETTLFVDGNLGNSDFILVYSQIPCTKLRRLAEWNGLRLTPSVIVVHFDLLLIWTLSLFTSWQRQSASL
jgi:hypothetical protein